MAFFRNVLMLGAIGASSFSALAPVRAETWVEDYGEAMHRAETEHKRLLLYFFEPQSSSRQQRFETEALGNAEVKDRLDRDFVAARFPLDYETELEADSNRLLDDPSLAELRGRPGIAIIDFAQEGEDYYGCVVSVLPLTDGKYYRFSPTHLKTLLDLPGGTLTQRTMIFAVRIHPERPRSTDGEKSDLLLDAACAHCGHQARIRKQGHHNWGSRFQTISARLPRGLHAKEVVAESWPGEGLVDAAVDCVWSWRQSSGHWSAVRADHPLYAYDIQRGSNGIWYATGLFGTTVN